MTKRKVQDFREKKSRNQISVFAFEETEKSFISPSFPTVCFLILCIHEITAAYASELLHSLLICAHINNRFVRDETTKPHR